MNSGFPDPEIECNAALNLGDNHMARGEYDEAERRFGFVEGIYRNPRPEDRFMLWRYSQHMLHSSGELWLARGDTGRAADYSAECLDLATRAGSKKNIIKARRLLGQVAVTRLDPWDAEQHLNVALRLAREIGNPPQLWKTLIAMGDLHVARGEDGKVNYLEALKVIERVAASLDDFDLREVFLSSDHVRKLRALAH